MRLAVGAMLNLVTVDASKNIQRAEKAPVRLEKVEEEIRLFRIKSHYKGPFLSCHRHCGGSIHPSRSKYSMTELRTPYLTVDLIIEMGGGIVLIERKNPPPGWALPGGFVDYGESLETAAIREAHEETSLNVELVRQFHAYSDPARDTRQHNVTVVFIARALSGELQGRDDARRAAIFPREALPTPLAFDHGQILNDYFEESY
jgi:ADP-ribose pyrophosphatase YjhB (NUDIX family)